MCSYFEKIVEEIFVSQSGWIMMERIKYAKSNSFAVGISGNIRLVNVVVGQQIHTDTLLIKIEDDLVITGCE